MATNAEFLALADRAANNLLRLEKDGTASFQDIARLLFLAEQQAKTWPGDDAPISERLAVALSLAEQLSKAPKKLDKAEKILRGIINKAGKTGADAAINFGTLGETTLAKTVATESATSMLSSTLSKHKALFGNTATQLSQASTKSEIDKALKFAKMILAYEHGLSRSAVSEAYHRSLESTAATDPDSLLVWRAERNACLNCLAYQGETVTPNNSYSPGLTFGDKPPRTSAIVKPPLHPNCRCEQIVWHESWGTGPIPLPAALKREARRSVLRGWSEYASNAAKGRAARRLLDQGVSAPKSVLAIARRLAEKYAE